MPPGAATVPNVEYTFMRVDADGHAALGPVTLGGHVGTRLVPKTGALVRREAPFIGDQAIEHFQDLYDHVLRIADLAESQRDILTGLRDADLAVTSNQTYPPSDVRIASLSAPISEAKAAASNAFC